MTYLFDNWINFNLKIIVQLCRFVLFFVFVLFIDVKLVACNSLNHHISRIMKEHTVVKNRTFVKCVIKDSHVMLHYGIIVVFIPGRNPISKYIEIWASVQIFRCNNKCLMDIISNGCISDVKHAARHSVKRLIWRTMLKYIAEKNRSNVKFVQPPLPIVLH